MSMTNDNERSLSRLIESLTYVIDVDDLDFGNDVMLGTELRIFCVSFIPPTK
jgi:hypothetical protein